MWHSLPRWAMGIGHPPPSEEVERLPACFEGSATMPGSQHVVPHRDGWAVMVEGGERATRVLPTQAAAIAIARTTASNQGTELVIHGRDGQIRRRDSHGPDPCPPKG